MLSISLPLQNLDHRSYTLAGWLRSILSLIHRTEIGYRESWTERKHFKAIVAVLGRLAKSE